MQDRVKKEPFMKKPHGVTYDCAGIYTVGLWGLHQKRRKRCSLVHNQMNTTAISREMGKRKVPLVNSPLGHSPYPAQLGLELRLWFELEKYPGGGGQMSRG